MLSGGEHFGRGRAVRAALRHALARLAAGRARAANAAPRLHGSPSPRATARANARRPRAPRSSACAARSSTPRRARGRGAAGQALAARAGRGRAALVSFAALPTKAPAASRGAAKLPLAGRGLLARARRLGGAAQRRARSTAESSRRAQARAARPAGRGAVAAHRDDGVQAGVVFLVDEGGGSAPAARKTRASVFVNGELFSTPIGAALAGACARARAASCASAARPTRFDRELDALTGLRCAICAVRARLAVKRSPSSRWSTSTPRTATPRPSATPTSGPSSGPTSSRPSPERARLLTEATGSLRSAARGADRPPLTRRR